MTYGHITSVCPHLHMVFSCLRLLRTLVIAFRAHLDNPEYSHLKIFNLITSMKTIFPN